MERLAILEQAIEYWRAGGVLLIPIALVCFGIWVYFLRARAEMLAVLEQGEGLEDRVLDALREQEPAVAARAFDAREGMLAEAVAGALAGGGDIVASFRAATERSLRHLRRDVVVLAGLTAAAPLLGLLGTVRGMVETFMGVSAAGQSADYVAAGISQALITTQVGLVVAIPGVFGTARLQRLAAAIGTRFTSCRMHISFGLARGGRS